MEDVINSIVEFVRVRQLNIAIAALVSVIYLIFQYRCKLFKGREPDTCELEERRAHRSRSRSRSCSRSPSRPRSVGSHRGRDKSDERPPRRGRRPQRRCPSYRDE